MNKQQRIKMMAELWPAACAFQKWNRNDDAKRYDIFARVLTAEGSARREHFLQLIESRGHISGNDLVHEDDISAVFKELKELAGKIPLVDPKKKQLLWVVRNQLRPCLALYVEQPDSYMTKILKERHKVFRGVSTIEDLSSQPRPDNKPSELMMFVFTLNDRIDALRSAYGDTGHMMCVRARVKCKCAECAKYGQRHLEVLAGSESEVPLEAELQPVTEEEPF